MTDWPDDAAVERAKKMVAELVAERAKVARLREAWEALIETDPQAALAEPENVT